jgi:IS605 OrfB family transposase
MQITIRGKVHEKSVYPILAKMGEELSRARKRFFVQSGILGRSTTELKREFIANEGITARQFNSIAFEVKGLISAQKEIKRNLIEKTKKKIKKTKEKIKKSKIAIKTHQFKRQLYQYELKLQRYQEELKRPSVCFGQKSFFKKQFRLKENGFQSHKEWKAEWSRVRNSNFFLIGSKDESFGNQSCQLLPGRLSLRLTNLQAKDLGQDRVEIPIKFTYEEDRIQAALERKQALHFRFFLHENGSWYVHLTFDLPEEECVTNQSYGAIGIDLNPSCIAVTEIDSYGNYQSSWQIPIHLRGKTSDQVDAIIGEHCIKIVEYAKAQKLPVVLEELDFENKKLQLRSRGMNRMLSQFAYSQFYKRIESQSIKNGVELKTVNPAYTSTIGKVKFSLGYGLSTHMGAAMAIARRALGFGERLRVKSKFRLSLPARNRVKHVWADWRVINPKVFPENYRLWEDWQCPEHPQGKKLSSLTHENDLTGIQQGFESEVTTFAQADAKSPHAIRRAYCSPGVME